MISTILIWHFTDGFHEKFHVVDELNVILPRLSDNAIVYLHDTNGSNESYDVPSGIDEVGIKVKYLKH